MNDKLVLLGGGHGLSNILSALKNSSNIKAIVNCADSGSSTGKLRDIFNIPAMGDIRKCLSILSNSPIAEAFEMRTKDNDCIGNLIISSLAELYDFKYAVNQCHNILGIKNNKKIIPISLDNYNIQGKYKSGKICKCESDFNSIERIEESWLRPNPTPNEEALQAIKEADYVILAPGSFYTSILVNLKITEISKLLKFKPVIWIANLMQEKYETKDYNLLDLYNILSIYTHIDIAIINNRIPTKSMLKNYENYLKPLTNLKLDIPIIRESLLICKDNILIHNKRNTYKAIQEAIRKLK